MHRFFVSDNQIDGDHIHIDGDDVNHIAHVLRLSMGEKIIISNRQGIEYCCIIKSVDRDSIQCLIESTQQSNQELSSKIVLFQGIPKQEKMELIIQKSIELGVFEIVPVIMSRSIVKINGQNKDKKNDRWQKIANAAAKQSQRAIIPQVLEPMTFDQAVAYAEKLNCVFVPYEKAVNIKSSKELLMNVKEHPLIGIFIGPEGGFADDEIAKLEKINASIISLGKRILRTETAGLVILSILMYNLEEE